MLRVLESNILVDEFKVSHILMKTNPMEGPDEIKKRFYKIKNSVQNGESFSKYAGSSLKIMPLRSKEAHLAGSQKN